jgi:hypothetical protein
MDIHPWTKYEVARIRDEERLLRARAAMQVRELRNSDADEIGERARAVSWLDKLRRREIAADGATVPARAGVRA